MSDILHLWQTRIGQVNKILAISAPFLCSIILVTAGESRAQDANTIKPSSDVLIQGAGQTSGSLPEASQTDSSAELKQINKQWSDLFAQKRLTDALTVLNSAILKFPNNAILYNARGYCHFQMGHPQEAKSDYDAALKLNPNMPQACLYNCQQLIAQRKFKEALVFAERAQKGQPNSYDALLARGICYLRMGMDNEAIASFNAYIKLRPNEPTARYNRALAYTNIPNWKAAIEDLEIAHKEFLAQNNKTAKTCGLLLGQLKRGLVISQKARQEADIYYRKASTLFGAGEYSQAVKEFKNSTEIDPYCIPCYTWSGVSHERLQEWDLALADYRKALDLDPKDVVALLGTGTCLNRQSKAKQALGYLNEAAAEDPLSYEIQLELGKAYVLSRDNDQAMEKFKQAVRLSPKAVSPHLALADMLAESTQGQEAIKELEQAIALLTRPEQSSDKQAYIDLLGLWKAGKFTSAQTREKQLKMISTAKTHLNSNRFQEAEKYFDKAAALGPLPGSAYEDLAFCWWRTKQYKKTIENCNQAFSYGRNTGWCYYLRGKSQYELGNTQAAMDDLKKALELNPGSSDFVEGLAEAYQRSGQYSQALAVISNARPDIQALVDVLFAKANSLDGMGKTEEATQAYRTCIESARKLQKWDVLTKSQNAVMNMTRGKVHAACQTMTAKQCLEKALELFNQKKPEDACLYADESIVLNGGGNNADAYILRSKCFQHLDNIKQSEEDIDKALSLNPNSYDAYLWKSQLACAQKKYDKAIEYATAAAKINPKQGVAYWVRAEAYQDAKDYQKAIDDWTTYIGLNPTYADLYLRRARCYQNLHARNETIADYTNAARYFRESGNTKEANNAQSSATRLSNLKGKIPSYENELKAQSLGMSTFDEEDPIKLIKIETQIIELCPHWSGAYQERARYYVDQKRYAEALADCKSAQELDDSDASVYRLITSILLDTGKYEPALENISKAILLEPKYYNNLALRGRAHLGLGKVDQAIDDLTQAIKKSYNNSEAHFYLAQCFTRIGRIPEAKNEYTICLNQYRKLNFDEGAERAYKALNSLPK